MPVIPPYANNGEDPAVPAAFSPLIIVDRNRLEHITKPFG